MELYFPQSIDELARACHLLNYSNIADFEKHIRGAMEILPLIKDDSPKAINKFFIKLASYGSVMLTIEQFRIMVQFGFDLQYNNYEFFEHDRHIDLSMLDYLLASYNEIDINDLPYTGSGTDTNRLKFFIERGYNIEIRLTTYIMKPTKLIENVCQLF